MILLVFHRIWQTIEYGVTAWGCVVYVVEGNATNTDDDVEGLIARVNYKVPENMYTYEVRVVI